MWNEPITTELSLAFFYLSCEKMKMVQWHVCENEGEKSDWRAYGDSKCMTEWWSLDRWVVTHSLADGNFRAHRPGFATTISHSCCHPSSSQTKYPHVKQANHCTSCILSLVLMSPDLWDGAMTLSVRRLYSFPSNWMTREVFFFVFDSLESVSMTSVACSASLLRSARCSREGKRRSRGSSRVSFLSAVDTSTRPPNNPSWNLRRTNETNPTVRNRHPTVVLRINNAVDSFRSKDIG